MEEKNNPIAHMRFCIQKTGESADAFLLHTIYAHDKEYPHGKLLMTHLEEIIKDDPAFVDYKIDHRTFILVGRAVNNLIDAWNGEDYSEENKDK